MNEIDEVLRVKDKIEDFLDHNFDGEEVLRLLTALSMLVIEIAYDCDVSHEDTAQLFIGIINQHMIATSGPTENDTIN